MRRNDWPRIINLALGVWLFISAFSWQHSPAQFSNTWLVGGVSALIAMIAATAGPLRFANTLLGVWLVISALALQSVSTATVWNNLVVGILMFAASLASGSPARLQRSA